MMHVQVCKVCEKAIRKIKGITWPDSTVNVLSSSQNCTITRGRLFFTMSINGKRSWVVNDGYHHASTSVGYIQ